MLVRGSGDPDIIGLSFHLNVVILITLRKTKVLSDLRSDQKKGPCSKWMTRNVGLVAGLVSFVPCVGTCSGGAGMTAPLGAASPSL